MMSPKTGKSSAAAAAAAASSSPSSSSVSSSSTPTADKPEPKAKIDPSFKSKRYRDKLRTEVKALESLLPVDRTALSRKLDSQTVFRLVLALLRIKGYFQGICQRPLQQADNFLDISHPCDAITCDGDIGTDDVSSLIQGLGCLQVLEGFLLVLTTDGTILYVSDNVLHYLGYNQVDLMHRCLYSIVHWDDMPELKGVLEATLTHLTAPRYQHPPGVPQEGRPSCHMESCGGGVAAARDGELCAPVSFICRMRCFSGSSVGYLKMHCSGKMVHKPGVPKTKRSSSDVVLLFCNPSMFMMKSGELTPDLQKNVFWSKHDLDLQVKEMDAKGTDIIGFSPEEMEKKSFYSLVHPEDLTALVTCHKLLIESGEVQTVYFRMQTKGGDWVWLTSRGKVISKNSKKFSIAFSHCPIRGEDSTYLQQEAILRRRYALTDLMYLNQLRQTQPETPSSSFCTPATPKEAAQSSSSAGSKARKAAVTDEGDPYPPCRLIAKSSGSPAGSGSGSRSGSGSGSGSGSAKVGEKGDGRKEEAGLVMDSSCALELECPSSWHRLSDRHSPVLPSSHVAHKISQREKQIQFQEFCKRQHMEANGTANGQTKFHPATWNRVPPHPMTSVQEFASSRSSGMNDTSRAGASSGAVGDISSTANLDASYSNGSSSRFAGFESCVGYNSASRTQNGNSFPPPYAPPWYDCGSVSSRVHAQPVSSDGSTPCMSPHRCGVAADSVFRPVPGPVTTNQFAAFQPPYGSCPDPQHVAATAYSSMPPSPPPSPPHAGSLLPPQQIGGGPSSTSLEHQHYRPELFQSWQPGYSHPVQQATPQGYRNDAASSGHSMSTITELQRTTEKFLPPLKKERRGEKDDAASELLGKSQERARHTAEDSCHPFSDRWGGTAAWTFNGHVDISWKASSAPSQPVRQMNVNGSVSVQQTVTNCSELPPYSQGHQGFQNPHVTPNPMLHASMSHPVPQSYPYPPLYPQFTPPPAYSYSAYPQFGYQGGQCPVNSFYTPTPNVPLKVNADFSCPVVERPLDLPSIGSFLEYLCEV